jgi:hypothetical protein
MIMVERFDAQLLFVSMEGGENKDTQHSHAVITFASDILLNHGVKDVVFETKSGPLVIRASVVIDCTGDGDIAARAGTPYETGREEDHLVPPMTLPSQC